MGDIRRNRCSHSDLAVVDQRTCAFEPIQLFPFVGVAVIFSRDYLRLRFLVGNFLRLVLATRRSSFRLIDLYICFDAPRSDDFERSPRLAESAAPAAICCFLDFAGILIRDRACIRNWISLSRAGAFAPQKVNRHPGKHDQDADPRSCRRYIRQIHNQQRGQNH